VGAIAQAEGLAARIKGAQPPARQPDDAAIAAINSR
jgi:hypothetical protein